MASEYGWFADLGRKGQMILFDVPDQQVTFNICRFMCMYTLPLNAE